jgi:hypothetical protein
MTHNIETSARRFVVSEIESEAISRLVNPGSVHMASSHLDRLQKYVKLVGLFQNESMTAVGV